MVVVVDIDGVKVPLPALLVLLVDGFFDSIADGFCVRWLLITRLLLC